MNHTDYLGKQHAGPRESRKCPQRCTCAIATQGHPHTASAGTRHSYVTHLIEAGYDPAFVQTQVGHSYSSTTALYTSVSSDFKQKTVQKMIARRIAKPEEESSA